MASVPDAGKLFRRVNKNGKAWGDGLTEKAVWQVVREYAGKVAIERLAPHDLRRTCARLCHASGGEIQFLLGHVSIQTTEQYLGCKQRIRSAVNDKIGIEPQGRVPDPTPGLVDRPTRIRNFVVAKCVPRACSTSSPPYAFPHVLPSLKRRISGLITRQRPN